MADTNEQQQAEVAQNNEEKSSHLVNDVLGSVNGETQEANKKQEQEIEQHHEENYTEKFDEENEKSESEDEEIGLPGCNSSDPKNEKYIKYKNIVKEIKCVNEVINDLKKTIIDEVRKPYSTNCEKVDLKTLLKCMECEMAKLRILINKAMNLQNFGSNRLYKSIDRATSFVEKQF